MKITESEKISYKNEKLKEANQRKPYINPKENPKLQLLSQNALT